MDTPLRPKAIAVKRRVQKAMLQYLIIHSMQVGHVAASMLNNATA